MKEFWADFTWMLTQWWFWILVVIGYILFAIYWHLFRQRTYKEIDHKLYIRHGRLGKWTDIEVHLKNEHPAGYELMKKEQDKKDGM